MVIRLPAVPTVDTLEPVGRALGGAGREPGRSDTLQMINSTIVRAHQHAAGGKGELVATLWAVRAVASRPRSTSGPMRKGLGSALS